MTVEPDGTATASFVVANLGARPLEVEGEALSATGTIAPPRQVLPVPASGEVAFAFAWDATNQPPGTYEVKAVFREQGNPANCCRATARVVVLRGFRSPAGDPAAQPYPVRLTGAGAKDIRYGESYELWAEVESLSPAGPVEVAVGASLPDVRRYLPTQVVRLAPGEKARVTWVADPRTPPLDTGLYRFRAFLPDCPTTTAGADFVVR